MIQKVLIATALMVSSAVAGAAPLLSKVSPGVSDYAFGVDFDRLSDSAFGDVTAEVFAVDLLVPSLGGSGGSTSGCQANDFAGFVVGSIALIQRGGCTFLEKTQQAEAAGAAAVLIFNEGNDASRLGLFNGGLFSSSIQTVVFSTTFALGDELRNGVLSGSTGVTVRMKLDRNDLQTVPEPATLALVGGALLGMAGMRRRGRSK